MRSMTFRMRLLNGLLMTFCIMLAALAGGAPARAQLGSAFGGGAAPHIHPALLAETLHPAPGGKVTMALFMQPDKGWHGYWDNPGDAGVGLTIDWTLPDQMTATPFRYPVPQRLLISGLMNHVYEHDYALLFDVSVPRDAKAGTALPIRGAARWLACTESICVPEQGAVSTVLTVGEGTVAPADRARFDAFRAQLPRPLDQAAHYRQTGDHIAIAVPYPAGAAVSAPWFFARTQGRILYAQPQTARRKGDLLIIETKVPEGAPTMGAIDGVLVVSPKVALQISASPGAVPSGGERVDGVPASGPAKAGLGLTGFLLVLGGAFLGGLILNVMPCVFPILSLKAISLVKAGGGHEHQVRLEALAYTAGIMVTCLALGALMLALRAGGAQIGWAFQLQDPRVIALLVLLMVAITLNLAGVFEVGVISLGQDMTAQRGHVGAFWTGALAAFVATPCTGPFMGAAMGAALVLPWALALSVFAGLGLGLAAPFLAIGWLPALRRLLPRPGHWMVTFRGIMAFPMGLTALGLIWLLWRQLGMSGVVLGLGLAIGAGLPLWMHGRAQRLGKRTNWAFGAVMLALLGTAALATPVYVGTGQGAAGEGLTGQPFSADKLAALRAAGKPVFLYFTADWCLTCKVNEANAIDNAEVEKAFKKAGVAVMVGDWTNADPAIGRFLEAHGRSGVPLYLYYARGAQSPQVLPQLLSPGLLTDLVRG